MTDGATGGKHADGRRSPRGCIFKRGSKYSVVISLGVDPESGQRLRQWFKVDGNKKDAEKLLTELLHQHDAGAYVKPERMTLADFLRQWLAEYATPSLAPRTVEGYRTIITAHLIPSLGSIPLTKLRPDHVQQYLTTMLSGGRIRSEGGLSARTVHHHHTVLHDALQTALKWGLVARNVADAVDAPRCQRAEMHVLDEEALQRVLAASRSTDYYVPFYLALFTGLRRSELLALRWSDVDLAAGQLSVSRALHQLRDRTFVVRAPKSAKGRRTVALPPSATAALRDHLDHQLDLCAKAGSALKDDDLLFQRVDGGPMLPDTLSKAWARLMTHLDIPGVRLHDARHTHASLMLKAGIHPKVVQERLGHSTISVTLDTYSHVAPGLQEAAARHFDELLTRSSTVAAAAAV